MDTVRITYTGPAEQVEVPFDGRWLTFDRGVPVDVPRALADGGAETVLDSGDRITSTYGGLLEQSDNWQLAKAKRTTNGSTD